MSLVTDTLEAARRLAMLVAEETAAIETRAAAPILKAMAEEKASLADLVEHQGEAMKRAGKAALIAEPAELRAALTQAMADLNSALAANGKVLVRRKALSEGLIDAVLAEARRQAGTQLAGYGRGAPCTEKAAAIACNTHA